jgi:hypothetical protein
MVHLQLRIDSTYDRNIALQLWIGRLCPLCLHALKCIRQLLRRFVCLLQFLQSFVETLCDIQQSNDIAY